MRISLIVESLFKLIVDGEKTALLGAVPDGTRRFHSAWGTRMDERSDV